MSTDTRTKLKEFKVNPKTVKRIEGIIEQAKQLQKQQQQIPILLQGLQEKLSGISNTIADVNGIDLEKVDSKFSDDYTVYETYKKLAPVAEKKKTTRTNTKRTKKGGLKKV